MDHGHVAPSYRRQTLNLLGAIRDELHLDDREMADRLHLTAPQLQGTIEERRPLSICSLSHFADSFNISLEAFTQDDFDVVALRHHHRGTRDYLPQAYTKAATGRMRSLQIYFQYLRLFHGPQFRSACMRRFQITEEALADPERGVNINLIRDTSASLASRGFAHADFVRMGRFAISSMKDCAFMASIRDADSLADAFDRFGEVTRGSFGQNFEYRLAEVREGVFVYESTDNADIREALKVKALGNAYTCDYKAGFFANLPTLLNLPAAIGQETYCVHRGDRVCQFEIDVTRALTEWRHTQ